MTAAGFSSKACPIVEVSISKPITTTASMHLKLQANFEDMVLFLRLHQAAATEPSTLIEFSAMAVLSGRSAYPRSLSMITDIAAQGPFARKRHTRCSKHHHYSITSS